MSFLGTHNRVFKKNYFAGTENDQMTYFLQQDTLTS